MKDREWLNKYKLNPKIDNSIYKNYQSPSLTSWDNMYGSLSSNQRNQYNRLINEIPEEISGKSAYSMGQYLSNIKAQQAAELEKQKQLATQVQQAQAAQQVKQPQLLTQTRAKAQPNATPQWKVQKQNDLDWYRADLQNKINQRNNIRNKYTSGTGYNIPYAARNSSEVQLWNTLDQQIASWQTIIKNLENDIKYNKR